MQTLFIDDTLEKGQLKPKFTCILPASHIGKSNNNELPELLLKYLKELATFKGIVPEFVNNNPYKWFRMTKAMEVPCKNFHTSFEGCCSLGTKLATPLFVFYHACYIYKTLACC